jgi:hypothetical protein
MRTFKFTYRIEKETCEHKYTAIINETSFCMGFDLLRDAKKFIKSGQFAYYDAIESYKLDEDIRIIDEYNNTWIECCGADHYLYNNDLTTDEQTAKFEKQYPELIANEIIITNDHLLHLIDVNVYAEPVDLFHGMFDPNVDDIPL